MYSVAFDGIMAILVSRTTGPQIILVPVLHGT